MAQVHQAAQGFTDDEWDNVLARIAVDEDFVQQIQAREKCSEEDLPMKLVELFNQRKKKRLSIVKRTYDVDVGCQAITRTILRDGK
ncbi:hypothetical protein Tco_1279783 [Tanacetum coccineum]